ncbi:MAG: FMN-binding negative transcriptional regulator [Burkholderiales bacterium]|nr:FMN-binding negative transcriptional regulator [Burkholderiales bacterium]
MYQPAHFAESRPEVLQRLIREHPFGLLVTDGASGLAANGVPFVLDPDPAGGPGVLRAHVARANPVWKEARKDRDSLVVFQGAQGYVSPAWYPSKAEHGKAVPTWNYIVVQGRGPVRFIEDRDWLHAFVSRLTDLHEGARTVTEAGRGAPVWAVTDAPGDYVESMLRAIVGVEIPLSSLVGKWKVSQNRSRADRDGVAAALGQWPGDEAAAMAAAVRGAGTAA